MLILTEVTTIKIIQNFIHARKSPTSPCNFSHKCEDTIHITFPVAFSFRDKYRFIFSFREK